LGYSLCSLGGWLAPLMMVVSAMNTVHTKPLHPTARISVAALFLIPLWYINGRLGFWSSAARELRLCLLCGAVAGTAAVLLVPVLIRGDWVQRVLALVLIGIPLLSLIGVFLMALEHYL
jgi:hypothetical protein